MPTKALVPTTPEPVKLSEFYDELVSGDLSARTLDMLRQEEPRNIFVKAWVGYNAWKMCRDVAKGAALESKRREAALQGADVGDNPMDAQRWTYGAPGVRAVLGLSFASLRLARTVCEVLGIVIRHTVTELESYAEPAEFSSGRASKAGWKIVMEDDKAKPTSEDEREIKLIENFVKHCGLPIDDNDLSKGTIEPPRYTLPNGMVVDERPLGWQPSFKHFIKCFGDDSMTLDWGVARLWPSSTNPERYPVACFGAVDAGRIRRTQPEDVKLVDGSPVERPYHSTRTNTNEPIKYVKVSTGIADSTVAAAYTEKEIAVLVRNPRTMEESNGYGWPEIEQVHRMIMGFTFAIETNVSRFEKDGIPRGILCLRQAMSPTKMAAFIFRMRESCRGLANRWNFPILEPDTAGDPPVWVSLDQSSRDLEYHQWAMLLISFICMAFKKRPSSIGFDEISPYRPPLSEASPEAKFERGDELCLSPLLKQVADFMNTSIIWKMPQWRGKYRMIFVGVGEYDAAQDAQTAVAQLQAGIATLAELRAERDLKEPPEVAADPIWHKAYGLTGGSMLEIVRILYAQQQAQQQQEMQKQQAAQMSQQQGQQSGQQPTQLQSAQQGKPALKSGQKVSKGREIGNHYLM
jgi:hypothetical protein